MRSLPTAEYLDTILDINISVFHLNLKNNFVSVSYRITYIKLFVK